MLKILGEGVFASQKLQGCLGVELSRLCKTKSPCSHVVGSCSEIKRLYKTQLTKQMIAAQHRAPSTSRLWGPVSQESGRA